MNYINGGNILKRELHSEMEKNKKDGTGLERLYLKVRTAQGYLINWKWKAYM